MVQQHGRDNSNNLLFMITVTGQSILQTYSKVFLERLCIVKISSTVEMQRLKDEWLRKIHKNPVQKILFSEAGN